MIPTVWEFTIYGAPAAQARPRFANGRSYRAGRSVQWEANAAQAMATAWEASHGPPEGRDEPLAVSVLAVFPRPKRLVWKRREMVRLPHTTKPDVDNVGKCVLDAVTQAGLIADDRLVHRLSLVKCIAAGNEVPRVEMKLDWGAVDAPPQRRRA